MEEYLNQLASRELLLNAQLIICAEFNMGFQRKILQILLTEVLIEQ